MLRAYGCGVTSFITKPLDFEHFIAAVRDLERVMKFLLALKTARQRVRLSDRQIFRLLRRQQEIEEQADSVFEQQISQIQERISGSDTPAQDGARSTRPDEIVRVAQKILETLPERRRTAHAPHSPESLLALARVLGNEPDHRPR